MARKWILFVIFCLGLVGAAAYAMFDNHDPDIVGVWNTPCSTPLNDGKSCEKAGVFFNEIEFYPNGKYHNTSINKRWSFDGTWKINSGKLEIHYDQMQELNDKSEMDAISIYEYQVKNNSKSTKGFSVEKELDLKLVESKEIDKSGYAKISKVHPDSQKNEVYFRVQEIEK